MTKERADKTREQAHEYRRQKHREALAMDADLNDFVLGFVPGVDRENDIAVGGKGPRYAIVEFAQKEAAKGTTYGKVLGMVVAKGDGKPFKIREGELLGYVCANEYCTLTPPDGKGPKTFL